MSLQELEKLASTNSEMPNNLNAAEQLFFLSLRNLYITYAAGKIDKNAAKSEKTDIYKQYEINSLDLSCWKQMSERIKKSAVLHHRLKDDGCELCKEYVKTMMEG